ncbi:MAG: arginine--tRNA ligase [Candidatus Thermoplasmatota archaeon]|jgi:arginyl-tRNA synthetase|nr:arginine--tRNA ligase [Candidatus Thermoplasmatota archaeon]
MKYPLDEAKKEIITTLENVLSELNIKYEIKLETPPEENMGDFAFPCFPLAPIVKKPPKEIAENILNKIKKTRWIEKTEAKNGYVNFYIDNKQLINSTLKLIIENKEKYGTMDKKSKKVIIEHTSANPNGPLHVGRARNPIIGDTLVRIFKANGYNVESQFYLDDLGKQVAILTWCVNNLKQDMVPKPEYDKPDHKNVGFYQTAFKLMEENQKISEEISEIVRKSENGDNKTIQLVKKAYTPVLEGIKQSLKKINITIDKFIPESDFVKDKSVDMVVEKLKKTSYCNEENGAYYLDLEPFGIQGRNTKFFFTRNDGTTLYATRDIAYHLWKAKQADILINILGEDHKLESKQVEIALKLLEAKIIPKVIFYAFVSLPEGKMSTRRGRVVYLDDLIDESIERAYQEVKKRRIGELTEKQMKTIANMVGIGALRYNIIKVQPEKDIVFKWEEALNFEGNAAPFIQYSHARASSILSKTKEKTEKFDAQLLKHPAETQLIKKLAKYPLAVEEACTGYRPHLIAAYLFDLASQFNQFYRDCPVLPEPDKQKRKARLTLVKATKTVLKNGLNLLGIEAPEEM